MGCHVLGLGSHFSGDHIHVETSGKLQLNKSASLHDMVLPDEVTHSPTADLGIVFLSLLAPRATLRARQSPLRPIVLNCVLET